MPPRHLPPPRALLTAAVAVALLAACAQPNAHGNRPQLPDGAAGPDVAARDGGGVAGPPEAGTPPADAAALDGGRPNPGTPDAAAPDASAADGPPDAAPERCTPQELGCSTDGKAIRMCDEQGRWVEGVTCGPQSACSAGRCLCGPGACEVTPILGTPGVVEALAGAGRSLFLTVNGTSASIRRLDLDSRAEQVLQTGAGLFTRFSIDADPMGNLAWCSEEFGGNGRSGQVVFGAQVIDTGPCTQVRKLGDRVFYNGQQLYRRALDGSAAEVVTPEVVTTFEIAGEHLYFFINRNAEAELKRFPLADAGRVESLLRRPDGIFRQIAVDGTHAYLVAEDGIVRLPVAGGAPEMYWRDAGPEVWALALTETHVYWSTSRFDGSTCAETQVWRQPKIGSGAVVLSTVGGHCAGHLFVLGPHIYTGIAASQGSSSSGPTQVLRIRL